MPFTSHYEHAHSVQHLAVTTQRPSLYGPSKPLVRGNSRMLGLSGRLANRPSDTKLARAGPAGAEPGVTNYSKS